MINIYIPKLLQCIRVGSFICVGFILLAACSGNQRTKEDFIVKKIKPNLGVLKPLAIKGLNGFVVTSSGGNPEYLVIMYPTSNKAQWKQDQVRISTVNNLNSDQIAKIYAESPEYLYLTENVRLNFLVKKLGNGTKTSQSSVTIPYFVLLNVDNNLSYYRNNPLWSKNSVDINNQVHYKTFYNPATGFGTDNSSNGANDDMNNSMPSDDEGADELAEQVRKEIQQIIAGSPYILYTGTIKVNLKKASDMFVNVPVKIRFKPQLITHVQILTGFKLTSEEYNTLKNFTANQKNK